MPIRIFGSVLLTPNYVKGFTIMKSDVKIQFVKYWTHANVNKLASDYVRKCWRLHTIRPSHTITNMKSNQIKIFMTAFKSYLLCKVCVETTIVGHKYRHERSTNASVRSTYSACTYPVDLLLRQQHGLCSVFIIHVHVSDFLSLNN